jgi:hypothetical protein
VDTVVIGSDRLRSPVPGGDSKRLGYCGLVFEGYCLRMRAAVFYSVSKGSFSLIEWPRFVRSTDNSSGATFLKSTGPFNTADTC